MVGNFGAHCHACGADESDDSARETGPYRGITTSMQVPLER
jgi:hypothetical protein